MGLTKSFEILVALVLTSFFEFPFYFTFLPYANTKMLLAICGLIVFCIQLARYGSSSIDKDFFIIVLLSMFVSLASLVSMTMNNTPDDSYLTYFVSMFVWLSAGYFVVSVVKRIHGYITVELFCNYLIGVGVVQCVIALMIDSLDSVKLFVDSFLAGEGYMGKNETRLYGIGCALDVAGSRFSVILIMISYLIVEAFKYAKSRTYILWLIISFMIIAVIGNIIGRTTSVGLLIAFVYMVGVCSFSKTIGSMERKSLVKWIVSSFALGIIILSLLYLTSPTFHNYLRFGFEGFVNLIETGTWEVSSNEQLKAQYVFPDNIRCWLIGDGYMDTTDNDPYYIGIRYPDFYMYTDVGYCRFIFYFGLLGLVVFSVFMIKVAGVCMKRHPSYKLLFIMMLMVNFIVWLKVSTDIFVMFAGFLCFAQAEYYETSLHHPFPVQPGRDGESAAE